MKQILPSLALMALLLPSVAASDEARHLQLAQQFDRLSSVQDKQSLAASVVLGVALFDPSLAKRQKELQAFALRYLESEDYALDKAQIYMKLFSEAELEDLVALAQTPAYRLLQNKRNAINEQFMELSISTNERLLREFRELVNK